MWRDGAYNEERDPPSIRLEEDGEHVHESPVNVKVSTHLASDEFTSNSEHLSTHVSAPWNAADPALSIVLIQRWRWFINKLTRRKLDAVIVETPLPFSAEIGKSWDARIATTR